MLFFYLAVKNSGKHCLSQVMKVNLTQIIICVLPTQCGVMRMEVHLCDHPPQKAQSHLTMRKASGKRQNI